MTNPTATPSLLIQGTHGADDPEKATLPFIVGNVAATADQDTVVFLTSEAVRLATRGYADDITFATHPPTGKILADFIANGGRVWACGALHRPTGHHRRRPHRRSNHRHCRQPGRSRHRRRQDRRLLTGSSNRPPMTRSFGSSECSRQRRLEHSLRAHATTHQASPPIVRRPP